MSRLLITAVLAGILAFLLVLLVLPLLVAEADLVALLARGALGLSNALFDTMPPGLANFINNLNLALTASTVGLSLMLGILILATLAWICIFSAKGIASLLRSMKKQEAPRDLPPIDMGEGFKSKGDGKGVLGRGLDTIDRD